MTQHTKITTPQLFSMLFISRMIVNLTYTPIVSDIGGMWVSIISNILSFIIAFIFIIPIYKICNKRQGMDISDNAYFLLGKWGIFISAVYAIYYFFVVCYTLSSFDNLVINAVDPNISLIYLSLVIVVISFYGAYKGIEALARANSIILVLIALSLISIIIALIPKIDNLNYMPIMYDDIGKITDHTELIVANTSCIPAIAMLIPFAKGNIKKGFNLWNISVFIVTTIFIIIITGSLGDYLKTQMFPFYTATSIAEVGELKRVDSLYFGMWICALFIKISLFLYLFSICMEKIFKKSIPKYFTFIAGIVAAIFSIFISRFRSGSYKIYRLSFLFAFTIITSLVIPIILIIADKIKCNKGK